MNVKEACNLIGLSLSKERSFEEVKKAWREQAKKYHPDICAQGDHMMKLINNAYAFLKKLNYPLLKITLECDNSFEKINNAIAMIISLEGLIIEVCGSWVWVSGDTKRHKKELKEAGFNYAAKKKMWSLSPEKKRFRKRQWGMEEIRDRFGSEIVRKKIFQELT